jgi:hypothetical protein
VLAVSAARWFEPKPNPRATVDQFWSMRSPMCPLTMLATAKKKGLPKQAHGPNYKSGDGTASNRLAGTRPDSRARPDFSVNQTTWPDSSARAKWHRRPLIRYWWLHSGYTATGKKKGQPVRAGLDSLGTRMDAGFPLMVPGAGLEPARLAAGDFESPESTNFTTRAVFVET